MGVYHTYYEVKVCKPKVKKLRIILENSSYRGSEMESALIESGAKLYSTADLLLEIQASEAELHSALRELFAFDLNGKLIGYWINLFKLFCLFSTSKVSIHLNKFDS